jgi:hypothetical protein
LAREVKKSTIQNSKTNRCIHEKHKRNHRISATIAKLATRNSPWRVESWNGHTLPRPGEFGEEEKEMKLKQKKRGRGKR